MSSARRFLLQTNLSTIRSAPPSPSAQPPVAAAESDVLVILAALMCALISVVGLVSVARCAWFRRGAFAGWNSGGLHQSPNKGLKKKVLESLPRYTYGSSSAAEQCRAAADSECAICLTEYEDGDEIRVMPQCNHRFHVQCVDTWLGTHSSCPSCRQILSRCRKCGEFPVTSVAPGCQPEFKVLSAGPTYNSFYLNESRSDEAGNPV